MARPRKSKSLAQQVFFRPHRNQFLFSDHYLNELLPSYEPEWSKIEGLAETFSRLKALYEKVHSQLPAANEKETERLWIQPILDILGHSYHLDSPLPTPIEGVKKPDYAFFASEGEKEKVNPLKGQPDYWPRALSVGDAKKWDFPLDRKATGKAVFSNANPNRQIDYYLRATQQHWGILTNGRLWRLYNQEKSYTLTTFYEVDIVELLRHDNLDDFKYFYLFFRIEAFRPVEGEKCFLDRAYAGSVNYAAKLGDSLKEQVYDALLVFAKGALAHPTNHLDSKRDLKAIHDNALIYLYRLLFILYAESRELLPMANPSYKNGPSLHALKLEVAGRVDKDEAFDETSVRLWARLRRLFRMVNEGEERSGVPSYNGGLFKPDKKDGHPFLEEKRIADTSMAHVLDLLARTKEEKTGGKVFVDYRTLGVRQLGSIYEGLLEFQLKIAEKPMVEVKEKGRVIVVPREEAGARRILKEYRTGDLYGVNNRGERKATGSYFTPEYIVDYIVKSAIGPLLEGKEKAEEILAMRFLDPAMGSGHFLVHVVDFVAKHLIENCSDVYDQDALKNVVQDEIPTLKRLVVERCVYGVDLNPLAVELAKLSLWLTCVAKDKPLSFLNHHLRCGNSLIGAWMKDLRSLPVKRKTGPGVQVDLFKQYFTQDVNIVLGGFKQIEELPSDSIKNIHKKERIWDEIRKKLQPFERVADLWVSTFFGNNEVNDPVYQDLVASIRHGGGSIPEKQRQAILTKVQEIAKEKKFFHWEIAFPEAFFDRFGKDLEEGARGFDAVIGNPPYVNANELNKVLSEYEKPFWKTCFESASGAYDLYILFLEQAVKLTRISCISSLITPNKFLSAPYAVSFREYLYRSASLLRLFNLSRVRVFEDPSIYPIVTVVENGCPSSRYDITVETPVDFDDYSKTKIWIQDSDNLTRLPEFIWGFLISEFLPLILKSVKYSIQLQDCSVVRASSTAAEADSYENALVGQSCPSCKKFINTGLIDRYVSLWGFTLLFHKGSSFVAPYLDLSNSVVSAERSSQYGKPKIIFAKMADRIEAFFDSNGEYSSANTNFVYDSSTYDLYYLTSILNSNVMSALYSGYFGALIMSGGYFQFQAPQLRVLPIRRIHFTTSEVERKKGVEGLKTLYKKGGEAGVLAEVERCLPKDKKGEFSAFKPGATGAEEKSDVVHDFLAFLAERMIALHKERQEKAKQFTGWLQEIKGIDTGALRSVLKEFWTLDEDGLAQVFKAKKIRASAENWSEIKDELAKYRKAILALNAKVAFTDDLIDRIVYRLYGLTPDEIELVKASLQ